MSQMMFLNIATFVPSYLLEDDKGKLRDISVAEFSVVLAMYNTARLLLSTTIGKSMNKVGRKNFIIIGFILMIISTIGFGALDYIPVTPKETMKWVFFSGAIICRLIQGVAGTILQVSGQTIMLGEYRGRKEKGLAYLSAARGLGFLGGPILGQGLYSEIKYKPTFLVFGILLGVSLVFTYFMLPGRLNIDPTKS